MAGLTRERLSQSPKSVQNIVSARAAWEIRDLLTVLSRHGDEKLLHWHCLHAAGGTAAYPRGAAPVFRAAPAAAEASAENPARPHAAAEAPAAAAAEKPAKAPAEAVLLRLLLRMRMSLVMHFAAVSE